MRTHNKLIVSVAVAAALAFSPWVDAHTMAVVVACNPGGPDAISQMPTVSQGSASTATAVCPSGTYPAVAGLGGSPALLGAIGAAAAVGGGLALTSGGGSSPASSAGQPALPGSGSGSGSNPAPGGGDSSGSGNTSGLPGTSGSGSSDAQVAGNGSAISPTGGGNTTISRSGHTYSVSAHQINGFPSPEISPDQLADYSATGTPLSSVGSPNSNGGGQSSGGQAGPAGGLGSFFGHLAHAIGATAQRIGQAVATGGTTTILSTGSFSGFGTTSGQGSNMSNTGSSGFSSLNRFTQANPTGIVSPMAGAAAGTIEIHRQPQPFTLTGGPNAYRDLVRWVSGFEGSVLDIGGGYLDTVVHPGTVTPERLPAASGGSEYYAYSRLSGTADFYITELGHRSAAYPGNPVRFVSQIATGMGNDQAAIWEAAQKISIQATGTYSSGPQFYASMPGDRDGPFWPSPFTLGGPEPDIAGVCHGFQQITHVSMGGLCWSAIP